MPKNFEELLQGYGFVRETELNLIQKIEEGNILRDVIPYIIPSNTTSTDLFSLSVYLYDFHPVKRRFPHNFYFHCENVSNLEIEYDNKDFILYCKYLPVNEGDNPNPCHFELRVKNSDGEDLPRDPKTEDGKKDEKFHKYEKKIVQRIFDHYLGNPDLKCVCLDKKKLKKWDANNNFLLQEEVESS